MATVLNLALTILRLAGHTASPPPSATTAAGQNGHYERS
jgi:hypothetical protein